MQDPTPLLEALEAEGALPERLQGFLAAARSVSGASGVGLILPLDGGDDTVEVPLVDGALEPAQASQLAAADGSRFPVGALGWLVGEEADGAALAFAGRLLARELGHQLEDLRRTSGDLGIAFVSHQMGNRLMPLLCNEAVSNDAKQLRGLIDLLRHLRGRIMLRDLFAVPTYLDLLKTFLRHRRSGEFFNLQVRCDEDASPRTIGPEQTGLLPELLHLGYLLRDMSPADVEVELQATVGDDGALELGFQLPLSAQVDALTLKDVVAPPGADPILELEAERLRAGFRLRDRPSVVVLDVAPPPQMLERLQAAGIETRQASGPEDALAEAIRPPQPWVVLIAGEAWPTARTLKRQLAIQLPALAMRCYRLDGAGLPVGYEVEAPEHVDLRALLRGT